MKIFQLYFAISVIICYFGPEPFLEPFPTVHARIVPCAVDDVKQSVFHFLGSAQAVDIGLFLSLADFKVVLPCEVFAYIPVSFIIIFVRYGSGMVVDSAEHYMAVRMRLVEMAHD